MKLICGNTFNSYFPCSPFSKFLPKLISIPKLIIIGSIEYNSLTSDTLEGGLDVMRKSFFIYENASIAVELMSTPEATIELEELCIRAARDGISLIAKQRDTGKVVGVIFNKLQVKVNDQPNYFTQFAEKCKYPSSKALVQFMIDADAEIDLYDLCKAECLLEFMFLAVLPEYGRRGIATKLCELSIELGKALKAGKNVKTSLTEEPLPIEPIPTVVSAIFTTIFTQNMSKKLGFVKACEISYEKLFYDGKSFASRIGSDTACTTVEYVLL